MTSCYRRTKWIVLIFALTYVVYIVLQPVLKLYNMFGRCEPILVQYPNMCVYICTCLYMFMHIYTHNVRNNLDLVFKHMRHLLSYHPVSTRYLL